MKKRNILIGVGTSILAIAAVLISPLGTPVVHAVQNIFLGFSAVTDIQVGGQDVEKIVYRGEVVWERESVAGAIQSITNANCPTDITVVQDVRDGHHYAVQKLADGNCWMLTNLAYSGAEAGTQLTSGAGQSTNTNVTASATNWNQKNPPYNNQKQWVDPTNANIAQYSGTRCSVAFRTTAASIDYTECGYMYNWCAALGNASAACAQASGDVANAGAGLCPAGWRLPTGGAAGEFQIMYDAIGGTPTDIVGASSTWRGVLSGQFQPGRGLFNQALIGDYWSATSAYSGGGPSLELVVTPSASTVNPQRLYNNWNGQAVRCVVQ